MKDDRAFILREDKAEEFLSKPKNKPREMKRYTEHFCGDGEFKVSGSPNIKLEEDVPYNEGRE